MTTEHTPPIPTDPRPLGYWLRIVDSLLSEQIAAALESEGVRRREWMVLNVLDRDVVAPEFTQRLHRKGKVIARLTERGWIAPVEGADAPRWQLTDAGREAKARIGESVNAVRTRVAGAVSPEDFATTMASLESIARELGWDESSSPKRGFGRRGGRGGRHHGHRGHGHSCHHGHHGGHHGEHAHGAPSPESNDIHRGHGPNLHHGFGPRTPGV
jgi:hypothetical protein